MLRVCSPDKQTRREFLRIGGLTLGGLSLHHWLAIRQAAAAAGTPVSADRSVIFLFLHGGPSQTETFDPKMTAPAGVRSATGEVATSVPGVTFGGTFPRLARLADRLIVVRSFQPGNANHDIKPVVCPETLQANMGCLYTRVAGPNHPATGMPRNVVLFPRAVEPSAQPGNENFGSFRATGTLGAAYAPWVPSGGGPLQQALTLNLPPRRLEDRRLLLQKLDGLRRRWDSGLGESLEGLRRQAFAAILGGVARAFDLSQEDPRTLARYDTAPLVRPEAISRRWNNYRNYVDNATTLGKLLLLARRLCEAGCGFVTVTTNFVWDMHADQNNAGVVEGMRYMGLPLDYALSALVEDLQERGLSDRILVVVCGEMGRTPKINARGGRDHWGRLGPLVLYGGGLSGGQVVGQSTRDASEPASDPVTIGHLLGTVLGRLLDPAAVRLMPGLPREVVRVITESPGIPGLS